MILTFIFPYIVAVRVSRNFISVVFLFISRLSYFRNMPNIFEAISSKTAQLFYVS